MTGSSNAAMAMARWQQEVTFHSKMRAPTEKRERVV